MVEGVAVGIAAEKFEGSVVEALKKLLDNLERFIRDGKLQQVLETNIRFHHKTVESVRNEKLLKYYETLTHSIGTFYTINPATATDWEFSLSEYLEILEGATVGDPIAAERAARQHAVNSTERLLAILNKRNSHDSVESCGDTAT